MDLNKKFMSWAVPLFVLISMLCVLIGLSGCVPEAFSVPSQQQVNRVKQEQDQFRITLAQVEAYVKTLPVGSPERRMQEQLVEKLEKGIAVHEAWLKAQESGDTSDLAKLIGELPYVGGWGGFAVALLGYFYQKRQKNQILDQAGQIVRSWEVAVPEKTPEVKSALSGVQDAATKLLVSKLKGEL